jgi:hypothetical protein
VTTGDKDRPRHTFPAFDLLGAVDPGGRDVPLTYWRDLSRFRIDEPGASALGIVERRFGPTDGRPFAGEGLFVRILRVAPMMLKLPPPVWTFITWPLAHSGKRVLLTAGLKGGGR